MSETVTCPSDASKLTLAVRPRLHRFVLAITASGTQWSGRMEWAMPTPAAASRSRGTDVRGIGGGASSSVKR